MGKFRNAEIYMQAHEQTTIYTTLYCPNVLERYVDEAYSVLNFFHHTTNVHQNMKCFPCPILLKTIQDTRNTSFLGGIQIYKYETLCTIWCDLCNLKNEKNTHGGVLILIKLQTETCNFTKSDTPSCLFFPFLNYKNGTKSFKASLI